MIELKKKFIVDLMKGNIGNNNKYANLIEGLFPIHSGKVHSKLKMCAEIVEDRFYKNLNDQEEDVVDLKIRASDIETAIGDALLARLHTINTDIDVDNINSYAIAHEAKMALATAMAYLLIDAHEHLEEMDKDEGWCFSEALEGIKALSMNMPEEE